MDRQDRPAAGAAVSFSRRRAMRHALAGVAAGALPVAWREAFAQGAYPNRPIRVVIPVPAGSAFDTVIRPLGQRLLPALGQPFVIDNKPGASLTMGTVNVAQSPPDGYSILLANDTPFSILPALNTPLQYDPDRDFAPLGVIAQAALMLIAGAAFPANTLQEFLAYVKANPGRVTYGTGGVGSQHHIAMETLAARHGLDLLHVPYQGIGPAFTGLLGGNTHVMLAAIALPAQHIKSGRLKAMAWTGARRHPNFADLPTFQEAGVADFVCGAWFGLFAPAATPPEITRKLASSIWTVVSSKEYTDNVLLPAGFDPNPSTPPEQFDAFLREDRRKWREWVQRIDPKKLRT